MKPAIKKPIEIAIEELGGVVAASKRLGAKNYQVIQQWVKNGVPLEHCAAIEIAAAGKVTRRDLRPGDWWLIWPELVTDEYPIPVSKKAA